MYKKSSLLNYLFLDIETIPAYSSFDLMPPGLQKIWLTKYPFKDLENIINNPNHETTVKNAKGLEDNYNHQNNKEKTHKEIINPLKTAELLPEYLPTVNDVYIQ